MSPSYVATRRDRAIRSATGNADPYRVEKEVSNSHALKLLPKAAAYVESGAGVREKFERACICSAVGNAMEFDIEDYSFEYGDLTGLFETAESRLAIDHRGQLLQLATGAKEVLVLADNAGEIVFDTVLARILKQLGARISVAVKEKPVLNDAVLADVDASGMTDVVDHVLTTGNDCIGFCRMESSPELLAVYEKADLVIAKGMGYLETLTEEPLSSRVAFILRAKCRPVASFLGVDQGNFVVMLAKQGHLEC